MLPKRSKAQPDPNRQESESRTTVPLSGGCLVAQLSGFRTMCWAGTSSTETELQWPGGSLACGTWFDLSVH